VTIRSKTELSAFDRIQSQVLRRRQLKEIEARHPHLDTSLLLVISALAEFAAEQDGKAGCY